MEWNRLLNKMGMNSTEVVKSTRDILKGSLLALVAFFFMAIFGILTKLSLHDGSFIWTSFIAYMTGALLLTPYVITKGINFLKSEHYWLLLGRAIFGTFASFLYTISINFIPIVNSTLLFNTAPIFIPILSVLFLRAKVAKSIWLAVILGFIGIVIIIHPTAAIFTQTGNILGLLSGIFLAIAYLMMKILTNTDSGIRIIFYYLGIGALMQIPFLFFYGLPTEQSALYATLSGVALLSAQLCLVNAYRYAMASEIGIYQYASVVFVGLIEWMFWGSVPSIWDTLGIAFVAFAGMIILRNGKQQAVENHD